MKEETRNLVDSDSENDASELTDITQLNGTGRTDKKEFTDIVGHGRWQLRIFILLLLAGVPSAWNILGMTFLAYPKDHFCVHPYFSNATTQRHKGMNNATAESAPHDNSHCRIYTLARSENRTADVSTTACTTWVFGAGYKSIVQKWNLVCDRDLLISTSQSVFMIGFLFAVFLSGQMSDLYGRHPTIMLNVAILLAGGFATAFSTSFVVFVVARFFVGMGHSGLGLTGYVLVVESVGPAHRAKTAILSGAGWNIGYMTLPLFAWLLQDWFLLQLVITIPCLLFISFYWWLPESPRWLLGTNKLKKAYRAIGKAANENKIPVKDLKEQVNTLYASSFKNKDSQTGATILDLLRTPNLRRKTLILYFIWMTIAFTYYGISLNTNDLPGDLYWNFFASGLVEIPGLLFCLLTVDRFGRKKPFVLTLSLGGLVCLACIFLKKEWWMITTSLAMCGKLFVSASFNIVYIYSAEIFPTVARNIGLGSCSTVARIGSSMAPFMRDLAKITDASVPLALFGALSLISGLLLLFLPETMNHPIPETLYQAEEFGRSCKEDSREDDLDNAMKPLM